MAATVTVVDRSRLGRLASLGRGAQGKVYRAPNAQLHAIPLAYKAYHDDFLPKVNFEALEALIALLPSQQSVPPEALLARAAWPVALVRDGPRLAGFLMPVAPKPYFGRVSQKTVLSRVEFLLNPASMRAYRGLALGPRRRVQFLVHFAETVQILHRIGVTVPDFSPRNVLFTRQRPPASYLVDCDSLAHDGVCPTPMLETPGWEAPPNLGLAPASEAADAYKFGLLVLRTLARDQGTMRVDDCPLPTAELRSLMARSLGGNAGRLPTVAEWSGALARALDKPIANGGGT